MITVYALKVKKFSFINYCYVVANLISKTALLIDPAWEPNVIEAELNNHGILPSGVLLTHHHPDHVNLASYFANHYDIPVYMGKAEIDYYRYTCSNLTPIPSDIPLLINDINVMPIATPGHTFGSICYLIDNNLFTGDTLFNEGCGMCIGKGSDAHQLYESLQKLKRLLSAQTIIYPGHIYGLPVGQPFAKLFDYNIYLQIQNAANFVEFRMRKLQAGLFNFK